MVDDPAVPLPRSSSSSGDIQKILDAVKNGEMNRTEAFNSILQSSSLRRTTIGGTIEGTTTNPTTNTTNIDTDGPRFSREDRRVLINQLMERKKELDHPSSPSSSISGAVSTQIRHVKSSSGEMPQSMDYSFDGYTVNENNQAVFPGDARTHRLVMHEAFIREEMFKECTFKPKIKELPNSYGVGKAETVRSGPFYDRVIQWQQTKEQAASIKKQQVDHSALVDCTFKPRMNRNSMQVMKESRNKQFSHGPMPAGERLYRSSETAYMIRARTIEEELRRERGEEDKECTFHPKLVTSGDKFAQVKPKFQLPKLPQDPYRVEERQTENCTFTPKVKGVNRNMHSAKMYLSTNVVERLTRGDGGSPGYPEYDNHDIATTPISPDTNVMDVASFMMSRNNQHTHSASNNNNNSFESAATSDGAARGRRPFAGVGGRRASSASSTTRTSSKGIRSSSSCRGTGNKGNNLYTTSQDDSNHQYTTAESSKERDKRLQEFLGRQQHSTIRQQQKMEKLRTASTPNFKPALCRKSLEISDQHFKGNFLDRVERDVLRRNDVEHKALVHQDCSCTFHPQVSKKVEEMKLSSRSAYEMSKGDLLRRETSHRMMKLRMEREEHDQLTFKPEISEIGKRMQSSLKLREDPAFFLQHYKGLESGKAQRRAMEKQHQLELEMEQCTFSPQTRECPAYVKRIARSMQHQKEKSNDQSILSIDSSSSVNKPNFKFKY